MLNIEKGAEPEGGGVEQWALHNAVGTAHVGGVKRRAVLTDWSI